MRDRLRMNHAALCVALLLASGCHSGPQDDVLASVSGSGPHDGLRGTGYAHFARKITLTREAPDERELGIHLLRVEPDGSAVIEVAETGETLSAKPGEYYLGAHQPPYNVWTFGERGLSLDSSDPDAQTAVLCHRWAGTR